MNDANATKVDEGENNVKGNGLEKVIKLPPRLYHAFKDYKHVLISPVRSSRLTSIPERFLKNLPVNIPVCLGCESGIHPLTSLTLEAVFAGKNYEPQDVLN